MRLYVLLLIAVFQTVSAEEIRVTTWNIEHLGSEGRGFGGGFGGGNLPLRTPEQIQAIASFIKNDLKSDVVAVQEISIAVEQNGEYRSKELEAIVKAMGNNWSYYVSPPSTAHDSHSMYVGYIWNNLTLRPKTLYPMDLPNYQLAGKALFDRQPSIGAFDILEDGRIKNDFVLVNVHLASGQHNDENHLIAMTLVEWNLTNRLKANGIVESDRIILGDFNNNPFKKNNSGSLKYSPAMYEHLSFKGYENYLTAEMGSTRMDDNLQSAIDHIFINKNAKKHVIGGAEIFKPEKEEMAAWRQTYSDHFPLTVTLKISSDDDVD